MGSVYLVSEHSFATCTCVRPGKEGLVARLSTNLHMLGAKLRRLGEVEHMESDQVAQQCQSSSLECTQVCSYCRWWNVPTLGASVGDKLHVCCCVKPQACF